MISVNIRSLFVCGALILFASVVYGAGSYQRTRDGQTFVWRDSPARGDEATWSGKRDKDGFIVATITHVQDANRGWIIGRQTVGNDLAPCAAASMHVYDRSDSYQYVESFCMPVVKVFGSRGWWWISFRGSRVPSRRERGGC